MLLLSGVFTSTSTLVASSEFRLCPPSSPPLTSLCACVHLELTTHPLPSHRLVLRSSLSPPISGALPSALAAWSYLRSTSYAFAFNCFSSYNECLTRCGAWDKLLDSFAAQRADPTYPPLKAVHLANAVRLAGKLASYPRFRSTGAKVGETELKRLCEGVEELVGQEVWREVEELLVNKVQVKAEDKLDERKIWGREEVSCEDRIQLCSSCGRGRST